MSIFRREKPTRNRRKTSSFSSTVRARTPEELDRRLKQKPARKTRKTTRRRAAQTSRFDSAAPMALGNTRVRDRSERTKIEIDPAIFALGWRYLSLAILLSTLSALVWLHMDDRFYVFSAEMDNVQYINPDDVFMNSGLFGINIFWVDEAGAAERIMMANKGLLTDATVEVVWPGKVLISVVEKTPAMIWKQGERAVWVDDAGVVISEANDSVDLLPIIVDDGSLALDIEDTVPLVAMNTARDLKALRGNIEMLHYDKLNGISYQDGRGWRVYFGIENDIEAKLVRYESFVATEVEPSGVVPSGIKVLDPEAIFIVP